MESSTALLNAAQDPAWTEYVQAWGAIIGLPAAVWGFIVLLRRDKQKDEMIRQLNTQTNVLIGHTDQLGAQIAQLTSINATLAVASEAIINETGELGRVRAMNRQNAIRPFIVFGERRMWSNGMRHNIALANQGQKAQALHYTWMTEALGELRGPNELSPRGTGALEFETMLLHGPMAMMHPFSIRVNYSDEDGNEYTQVISTTGADIRISNPNLVRSA